MYRIKLTARAKKELKKLKKLHLEVIDEILLEIKENPFVGKALTRELTGKFSYRVSTYRIIYLINQKDFIVQVLTIGHRSKIYF